ncbi:MAG: DUF1846 domain-containing protein [Clostridia bacterium]|nr:DUF1846 domain-containing protein [Clostridia bacterium]
MKQPGFDSQKYIRLQSERIRERIAQFGGKLYLEFGGKLFDDYHASRVLPGFAPDNKIQMLLELKDQAEIVIAINANDIEKNKRRGDLGITYDTDLIRLVDVFRDFGLYVGSIALTQYTGQPSAELFEKRMQALGLKVYRAYRIANYPSDVATIVSDAGYGRNDYIETTRSLVVVTAPGPGSGKMATCLSQLYHEHKRGIKAGYAKFETFPIWNLPLKHPVNLAYEAATADLNDVNMIDPFHLEAYGETAVNYNRDIEVFPVLKAIFERIYGECPYKSPTDMGVNMVGHSIVDDAVCREASCQEVIRRYYKAACSLRQGLGSEAEMGRLELLMRTLSIDPSMRRTVPAALEAAEQTGEPATAIELPDGRVVVGKTKELLGASSAALLNALKALSGIPDEVKLISPTVIEPIQHLKVDHMGNRNPRLHTDEVLLALAICAATDETASRAMDALSDLQGCEAHSSVILSQVDDGMFKKLGMNLTCEPTYQNSRLYHK